MTQSSLPVAAGSMLAGKYRIDRVLGEGGMGVVVAATHVELEQKVAIKFLLPDALANADVVARFSREARAAARIRGEHVARVIDVGALENGAPYIVMEYLEGTDLADLLFERGTLTITETVSYVLQACEALAEAHAAGIVHRDIKPANLFLAATADRSHIIKVLDFGISKTMDPSPASGSLTRTSAVLGSAFYLSPEQLISAKSVDQRADIWALGIVLYQLLSGRVPFDGESMPEVVAHILRGRPIPLRQLRPDVSDDLAAIVARCLRELPRERYASVLDLAHALAPYGGEHARISVDKIGRVLGGSTSSGASSASARQSPLAASFEYGQAAAPLPATGRAEVPSVVTDVNGFAVSPRHAVGDRTNMPWVAGAAPVAPTSPRWLFALAGGVALLGAALLVAVIVHFGVRGRSSAVTSASATAPVSPSATAPSLAERAASVAGKATTTSQDAAVNRNAGNGDAGVRMMRATGVDSAGVGVSNAGVSNAGVSNAADAGNGKTSPRHTAATVTASAPASSVDKVLGMKAKF